MYPFELGAIDLQCSQMVIRGIKSRGRCNPPHDLTNSSFITTTMWSPEKENCNCRDENVMYRRFILDGCTVKDLYDTGQFFLDEQYKSSNWNTYILHDYSLTKSAWPELSESQLTS